MYIDNLRCKTYSTDMNPIFYRMLESDNSVHLLGFSWYKQSGT